MKLRGKFDVTPFTNPSGGTSHRVTGTKLDGTRIRENYPNKVEANGRKQELENEAANVDTTTTLKHTDLTREELKDAETAIGLLPKGKTLVSVLTWYLENYREPLVEKTIAAAIEEFIQSREQAKRRPDTIRDYKGRVRRLGQAYGTRLVSDITSEDLAPLIHRPGTEARDQINNKTKMGTFFKWTVRKKYCLANPVDDFDKIHAEREKPEVLTLPDVRRLLAVAASEENAAALPYVALALFAGIRPKELSRLKWDNIDFEHKSISITAAIAKKRGVRDVAMSENLIKFLGRHAIAKTPIKPKNWRRIWDRVRVKAGFGTEAGLKPWVEDVMRHTAISHHYLTNNHEGKTARWAGNTPDVIHTYYKNLVKEKDTKEFWSLTPASLKRNKIVKLKIAA